MTIESHDVGGSKLPETDGRQLQRSVGITASGSMKIKKFRDPDKIIDMTLVGKSTAVKDQLATDLLAVQTGTVTIVPDAHVNLGNGNGASVEAYWLGPDLTEWKKDEHDAWTIPLQFKYSS